MHHAPATCVAVAATAAAAAAAATVTTTTAAAAAAIADADSSAVPDRESIRAALTAARGRFAAAATTRRVQQALRQFNPLRAPPAVQQVGLYPEAV